MRRRERVAVAVLFGAIVAVVAGYVVGLVLVVVAVAR